MIMYDYVWLCMIMYDYVWLCMIMYDYVWLCMIICVYIDFADLDFSFFDKFVARTIDLTISIGREPNNHPHGALTVIATVAVPAFQGTCHRLPSSFLLGSMWMSYERCHCLLLFVSGYGWDGSAVGSGWTFDDVFPALRPEPQKTNQGCPLPTSDWQCFSWER